MDKQKKKQRRTDYRKVLRMFFEAEFDYLRLDDETSLIGRRGRKFSVENGERILVLQEQGYLFLETSEYYPTRGTCVRKTEEVLGKCVGWTLVKNGNHT